MFENEKWTLKEKKKLWKLRNFDLGLIEHRLRDYFSGMSISANGSYYTIRSATEIKNALKALAFIDKYGINAIAHNMEYKGNVSYVVSGEENMFSFCKPLADLLFEEQEERGSFGHNEKDLNMRTEITQNLDMRIPESEIKPVQTILDACCGGRMFWFDKENPDVLFADIRDEKHILCDGRKLEIKPDLIMDFRDMPFIDNHFDVVVFDPPHLNRLGKNSWMAKKYGVLNYTWRDDIAKGFNECLRVLKPSGILIFKWNETQIKVSEILKLALIQPLLGNISGKRSNTHWICFMKRKD